MDFSAEYATGLIRGLHAIGTLSLFGILVFRLTVACPLLPQAPSAAIDRFEARLDRLTWLSLALATAMEAAWLGAEAVSMSGLPPVQALSGKVLGKVLFLTTFGHTWITRLTLEGMLALLILARKGRPEFHWPLDAAGAVTAGGILTALAFVSHGAALEGAERPVAIGIQAAHLLAAGAWLGALLPLFLLLEAVEGGPKYRGPALGGMACQRFSGLGILCVAILAASALGNSLLFVGGFAGLFSTFYGLLVLVKLVLFLTLIGFASWNRFHWTPLLFLPSRKNRSMVCAGLRRSIALETGVGILLVGVAGLLSSTPPGEHSQPWWPFSFRLSGAALELPAVYNEILIAGIGAAIGLFIMAGGIFSRRLRRALIPAGLVVTAFFVATPLQLLSVTAYPTSFRRSPTGFTVQSVAAGERLFAANCVACHGPLGKGDGIRAKSLPIPPADLTAEHVRDHPVGDLFWWITNGMDDGIMPPFGGSIPESGRWNLIDYVRAWNDAVLLAAPPDGDENAPKDGGEKAIPAPGFRYACPDGSQQDLSAPERKAVVALIFPRPGAGEAVPAPVRRRLEEAGILPVLGPGAGPAGEESCVAEAKDLERAYALYAPRARDAGTLPDQVFLIDRDGWLRGRQDFVPGALTRLLDRARAIEARRLAPPGGGGHMHGH